MIAAKTLDWVAIGGVVAILSLLVSVLVGFPWFRPKFKPRIDGRRQAIDLRIQNKGRKDGLINDVAVVDGQTHDVAASFTGFPGGNYKPTGLAGRSQMRLIIQAAGDDSFPEESRVRVTYGVDHTKMKTPKYVADVSFWGVKSELPG
jgi:hypothetical protein